MQQIDIGQLRRACRIFLDSAYPGGPETIPVKKRVYYDLPADSAVADFLPPAPAAEEVCQALSVAGKGVRGYALRLGSAHFAHLKLKLQLVDSHDATAWVYLVDTHDAFSRDSAQPPPAHPDAEGWAALQAANRDLKERIEKAFEAAGLTTFNSLLRGGLT
jgi:hypothetical protein